MKEWAVIYHDEYAVPINSEILYKDEPDVLMEAFIGLDATPNAVKVIVQLITEDGRLEKPFAIINKVVS